MCQGFGARLHDAMCAMGFSKKKLANALGVGLSTIYRWLELIEPPALDPVLMYRLADTLCIAARFLMLGEGERTKRSQTTDSTNVIPFRRNATG